MAIKGTVTTNTGESRELYIRLNNIEASNHGVSASARFRGFLTREAYESGKHYAWEHVVELKPDVAQPLWPQAYDALKDETDSEGSAVVSGVTNIDPANGG